MKHIRYIKIIGIISALFFLVSCGGGGGGGAASVGSSLITLTIGGIGPTAKVETGQDTLFANLLSTISPSEAEAGFSVPSGPDFGLIDPECGIPPFVHMIRFVIEGDGMATITRDVLVNGRCELIETFEVPDGPARNFMAFAFDEFGFQTHSGNTVETIPAPDNYVPILMEEDAGCDLYVSIEGGSNEGDCSSIDTPCQTITYALTQTPLGDETICVLPGYYYYDSGNGSSSSPGESYPLIVDRNITLLCLQQRDVAATAGNGIGLPFGSCVLDGTEIWSECSYANTGVEISNTAKIRSFTIQNFPPYQQDYLGDTGILVRNGTPLLIDNFIRQNVVGIGIIDGSPNIFDNVITNNGTGIIILPNVDNPLINENSIFCNVEIDLKSNYTGGTIDATFNSWDAPLEVIQNTNANECLSPLGVDVCYEGVNAPNTAGADLVDVICGQPINFCGNDV